MTISIALIGGATALVLCATSIKVLATGPTKANKAEKAEIMKQLLALSESENRASAKPTPSQSRTPLPTPRTGRSTSPRQGTVKISQPIRSNK